jgi:hypothetical protein
MSPAATPRQLRVPPGEVASVVRKLAGPSDRSSRGVRCVELLEGEAAVVVGEDLPNILRHGVGAVKGLDNVLHGGEQLLIAVLRHPLPSEEPVARTSRVPRFVAGSD